MKMKDIDNIKAISKLLLTVENLKTVERTGWVENGINNPESVMDHIGSTNILFTILSSTNILSDLTEEEKNKVYEMISLSQLRKLHFEKSISSDLKYNDEEVINLLKNLPNSERLVEIYVEFIEGNSKLAKLVKELLTIESDFQAKKYEQNGLLTKEAAKNDVENNYPEDLKKELENFDKPSDPWLTYNSKNYENSVLKDINDVLKRDL